MKEAFQGIWTAITYFIGAAMVWAILAWVAKANARMWGRVADRYSGTSRKPLNARKAPETIVIAENDPADRTLVPRLQYRQYATTSLALHDDGIALSQIPPFGPFCRPLFLPFEDMGLRRTDWLLWREPYAIRMRGCPTTDIVLGRDTVQWIREKTREAPFD